MTWEPAKPRFLVCSLEAFKCWIHLEIASYCPGSPKTINKNRLFTNRLFLCREFQSSQIGVATISWLLISIGDEVFTFLHEALGPRGLTRTLE